MAGCGLVVALADDGGGDWFYAVAPGAAPRRCFWFCRFGACSGQFGWLRQLRRLCVTVWCSVCSKGCDDGDDVAFDGPGVWDSEERSVFAVVFVTLLGNADGFPEVGLETSEPIVSGLAELLKVAWG